jgi:hypothetical protein
VEGKTKATGVAALTPNPSLQQTAAAIQVLRDSTTQRGRRC